MLGKTEDRRRGCQRIRWLDGIIDAMDMNLGKLWEMVKDRDLVWCSPWGCKDSDTTGRLNNNNKSNIRSNFMPKKLETWIKQIISLKDTIYQNLKRNG